MKKCLTILITALLLTACRDAPKPSESGNSEGEGQNRGATASEEASQRQRPKLTNQLANAPTALMRAFQKSAIPWQIYDPSVAQLAAAHDRPIFLVILDPTIPLSGNLMQGLESPELINLLKNQHIPVLADAQITPGLVTTTHALSKLTREAFGLPRIYWLTPQGAVLSGKSYVFQEDLHFRKTLQSDIRVVLEYWQDSREYVKNDSQMKNRHRREALTPTEPSHIFSSPLSYPFVKQASHQISLLYDPISERYDLASMAHPFALFSLIYDLAAHPATPAERSQRDLANITENLHKILTTPIWDPLNGSVYFAAKDESYNRFVPSWLTKTQAQFLSVLARHPNPTPKLQTARKALLAYLQTQQDERGLYQGGATPSNLQAFRASHFLTLSEIKDALNKEEFSLVSDISKLGPAIGNIPYSVDPKRDLQGKNNLYQSRWPKPSSPEADLLQSAWNKLKKIRTQKHQKANALIPLSTPNLHTQSHVLRAYTHLARHCSHAEAQKQAATLSNNIRQHYWDAENQKLSPIPLSTNTSGISAHARDHSHLIESLQQLYSISLDPELLAWSQELMGLFLKLFPDEHNYLDEFPPNQKLLNLPSYSRNMTFSPSTWAAAYRPMRVHQVVSQFGSPAMRKSVQQSWRINSAIEGCFNRELAGTNQYTAYSDYLRSALIGPSSGCLLLQGKPDNAKFQALHQAALKHCQHLIPIIHISKETRQLLPNLPEPEEEPHARFISLSTRVRITTPKELGQVITLYLQKISQDTSAPPESPPPRNHNLSIPAEIQHKSQQTHPISPPISPKAPHSTHFLVQGPPVN